MTPGPQDPAYSGFRSIRLQPDVSENTASAFV